MDKYELHITMRDNADGGDNYYTVIGYETKEDVQAAFEAWKAAHNLENLDRDSAFYSDCHLAIWEVETGECLDVYEEYVNKIYSIIKTDRSWSISAIALYDEKKVEEFDLEQDEDCQYGIDDYYETIFDFKYNTHSELHTTEGLRTYYVIK